MLVHCLLSLLKDYGLPVSIPQVICHVDCSYHFSHPGGGYGSFARRGDCIRKGIEKC